MYEIVVVLIQNKTGLQGSFCVCIPPSLSLLLLLLEKDREKSRARLHTMKLGRLRFFWIVALLVLDHVIASGWSLTNPDNDSSDDSDNDSYDVADTSDDDDDDYYYGKDDLIERNPQYGESSKSAVNSALANTKTSSKKKKKSKSKSMVKRLSSSKFLKKHGLKLTLLVAVVAFRKELRRLVWRMCSKPVRDPKTGEWTRRAVMPRPTSVLKILVFLDVMRRMQSATKSNQDGSSSPSASPLLTLLLGGNPAMAILVSKLLSPANSAYIPPIEQHFTLERINERYTKDALALDKTMDPDYRRTSAAVGAIKKQPSSRTSKRPSLPQLFGTTTDRPTYNETVILMDWTKMDSSVSKMDVLRDGVSFLLHEYQEVSSEKGGDNQPRDNSTVARDIEKLEVVVNLESPGGSAADYALASEQLLRLRRRGIKVTICVDKVAASGGYMIACTSSPGQLFAAPFAVLGSIGVIGQSVNIHKALKGWGVEPLVFRGGKDKAPVGLIGEITKEGIAKVQDIVDSTHRAFKKHVAKARPVLAERIEALATGDIWIGYDALEMGLVDRLVTSDEYIGERVADGARVLKLIELVKPRFPFARPTTASGPIGQIQQRESYTQSLLLHILSYFQPLIHHFSSWLEDFVQADHYPVNDVAPRGLAAKHMTAMNDLHMTSPTRR